LNVLVTGAGGFVGANLVRTLVARGDRVVGTAGPAGLWRLGDLPSTVTIVDVDVRDRAAVDALVGRTRPQWIFHLAAFGAYSWQTDRRQIFDTNLFGTINVLEAAERHGVESFVGAGSSSEYGFKDHAPSERELLEPNSDYAVAKAAAGQFALSFGARTGLTTTWLRLYSVYGPFEDPRRFVPRLLVHGLRDELPSLADPSTARDFVHVADVCSAFLAAAERHAAEPAVYNVGTGVQTTLEDVVALVRHRLGLVQEPVWGGMASRSWDTPSWVADPARAKADLGWDPGLTLEDGIVQTIAWLRSETELRTVYERELAGVST
jgi:nucleoside-diphosphate-sugar epimerase